MPAAAHLPRTCRYHHRHRQRNNTLVSLPPALPPALLLLFFLSAPTLAAPLPTSLPRNASSSSSSSSSARLPSAASPSPRPIVSIKSPAHLRTVLLSSSFTFVKFFHPACPHCQAIAPAYRRLPSLIPASLTLATPPPPPPLLPPDAVSTATAVDAAATPATAAGEDLTNRTYTLAVAEVDMSLLANEPLYQQHAPHGVPALVLFRADARIDAFEGDRTAPRMAAWIVAAVRAHLTALPVEVVSSLRARDAFLRRHAARPVALTALHPHALPAFAVPAHRAHLAGTAARRWAALARNLSLPGLARPLALAVVTDPTLLYPLSFTPSFSPALPRGNTKYARERKAKLRVAREAVRKRFQESLDAHAAPPYAVVAPRGRNSSFDVSAAWLFPADKDAPALDAFVHAHALPAAGYTTLDADNANALLKGGRPLAVVLANATLPSSAAEHLLYAAADARAYPPLQAVYVNAGAFPDVAALAGPTDKLLAPPPFTAGKRKKKEKKKSVATKGGGEDEPGDEEEDEEEMSKDVARLVLLREGNTAPFVRVAPHGSSRSSVGIALWLRENAQNFTAPLPLSRAGEARALNASSLHTLSELEPRTVALLVTRTGQSTDRTIRSSTSSSDRNRSGDKEAQQAVDAVRQAAGLVRAHAGMLTFATVNIPSDTVVRKEETPTALAKLLRGAAKGSAAVLVCGVGGSPDEQFSGRWEARAVARFARECAEVDQSSLDDEFFLRDVAAAYIFAIGIGLTIAGVVGWRRGTASRRRLDKTR